MGDLVFNTNTIFKAVKISSIIRNKLNILRILKRVYVKVCPGTDKVKTMDWSMDSDAEETRGMRVLQTPEL